MRQSNVARGLAVFVAGAAVLWLLLVPDAAGRCQAQCFSGVVGLLVTGVLMIANLAVAGSILIPGAQQYVKRSGAAVAALWGLSFALAYVEVTAQTCLSSCPVSTFDIVHTIALLIADVALVGIIFLEGTRLANGMRSSWVGTVTFSRLKVFAVFGWGLVILDDIADIVGGRANGLTLLGLMGSAAIAIWLATVQLTGEQ